MMTHSRRRSLSSDALCSMRCGPGLLFLLASISSLTCHSLPTYNCTHEQADRLLDPGFEAELRIIMHNLPSVKRQTLLFSATITRSISALQEVTLKKAVHFEAFEGLKVVERCKQEYCFVPAKVKEVYLVLVIRLLLGP